MTPEEQIFNIIGEDGFDRLTAAFYRRVRNDDILAPMYPANDLPGAQQRLRDFLIYRFGGSSRYIEQRGHPRLRMRHFPFHIDRRARDRWMSLMTQSMAEVGLPAPVAQALERFFGQTATHMINQPG